MHLKNLKDNFKVALGANSLTPAREATYPTNPTKNQPNQNVWMPSRSVLSVAQTIHTFHHGQNFPMNELERARAAIAQLGDRTKISPIPLHQLLSLQSDIAIDYALEHLTRMKHPNPWAMRDDLSDTLRQIEYTLAQLHFDYRKLSRDPQTIAPVFTAGLLRFETLPLLVDETTLQTLERRIIPHWAPEHACTYTHPLPLPTRVYISPDVLDRYRALGIQPKATLHLGAERTESPSTQPFHLSWCIQYSLEIDRPDLITAKNLRVALDTLHRIATHNIVFMEVQYS